MNYTVSVIILTRNRSHYLNLGLKSLINQTTPPEEVVILDNNSTDSTPKIIRKYSSQLPIRTKSTTIQGYPQLYNHAVAMASQTYIAFLDDDCIADKNWLKNIKDAHKLYPNSAIMGKTLSLPKDNFYAQIMQDHYANWVEANMITSYFLKTCDNKNLSLPLTLFNRFKFSSEMAAGSEDLELGFRLTRNHINIVYEPEILAYHHERTTLKQFLKQHQRIAKSESILDKKLSSNEKIGKVLTLKNKLILKSFIKREWHYIQSCQLKEFFLLPFVYLLLVATRVFYYQNHD